MAHGAIGGATPRAEDRQGAESQAERETGGIALDRATTKSGGAIRQKLGAADVHVQQTDQSHASHVKKASETNPRDGCA